MSNLGESTELVPPKERSSKSNFGPALGNFSIQYNMSCAGIALLIMQTCGDETPDNCKGDFPEPLWVKYTLLGLVFAGAVAGMFSMGTLGDLIGRTKALAITLSLTVIGALVCALASWGSTEQVYEVICLGRFILGVGVGGIYPLSATSSSESSSDKEHGSQRVGWAFFWQTPGAMAPYVLALALLSLPRPPDASPGADPSTEGTRQLTSLQFRLLMGFGALPAAVVLWVTLSETPSQSSTAAVAGAEKLSLWQEISAHPEYARYLIGTGGTWFLYDVSYYGTSIFLPVMLRSIFSDADVGLRAQCWHAIAVTALGIPGCIVAILLMAPPRGPRAVLLLGFGLMTAAFALTAVGFVYAPDNHALSVLLLCIVSFALNCGPNVATYVLPTVVYHSEVRSTFHGVSAGCGKLGAVVGTFLYAPIQDAFGLPAVMWTQAAISAAAALLALATLPPDGATGGGGGGAGEAGESASDEEAAASQALLTKL